MESCETGNPIKLHTLFLAVKQTTRKKQVLYTPDDRYRKYICIYTLLLFLPFCNCTQAAFKHCDRKKIEHLVIESTKRKNRRKTTQRGERKYRLCTKQNSGHWSYYYHQH